MLFMARLFSPIAPAQGLALRLVMQRLWRVGSGLHRWAQQQRQQRRDRATLARMSNQELNDLGIGRSEIAALLDTPALWRRDRY